MKYNERKLLDKFKKRNRNKQEKIIERNASCIFRPQSPIYLEESFLLSYGISFVGGSSREGCEIAQIRNQYFFSFNFMPLNKKHLQFKVSRCYSKAFFFRLNCENSNKKMSLQKMLFCNLYCKPWIFIPLYLVLLFLSLHIYIQ